MNRSTTPPAVAAAVPGWYLEECCENKTDGRQCFLHAFPFTINRLPEAALQIDHGSISKRHAEIMCDDSRLFIEDHGSTNGTFVNGIRASGPVELRDGDLLQFANFVFRVGRHEARQHAGTLEVLRAQTLLQFERLMSDKAALRRGRSWQGFLLALAALSGIYALSQYNYLLFHTLVETSSAVVAFAIFMLFWNAQRFLKNGFYLFIGIACLFAGIFDLGHAMTQHGISILPAADENVSIELKTAGRWIAGLSFMIAPLFLRRQIHSAATFVALSAIVAVVLCLIFAGVLPDFYTTQTGMTSFAHTARGLSCAAFLAATGFLAAKRQDLDTRVFTLIVASLLIGSLSEFTSCISLDYHGCLKVLEHLFEAVSLYMIYKAFIEVGLMRPYDLVFRSLKQGQEEAQRQQQFLEVLLDGVEQAKEEAESATRAKSEFLANMSHEIRTPMTAILGYTDILAESVDQPDQQEAIQTIKRNSNHLLALINDILDLSKIEAGKLQVERFPVSPLAILGDVVALLRMRADTKGFPLTVECCGPLPQSIQTDPTRLRQILVNLVGNAIKFTETGDVKIVVRLTDRNTAEAKLQFEVMDTGVGICPEKLGGLFQPFTQADATTTRKFGGTGLGLAISKRLAEMLGGDIVASSVPGKGSNFALTVATGSLDGAVLLDQPAESVAQVANKREPAAPPTQLNCRILLAEDGPDNQRLISFVLRKAGAEVVLCENGQKAMERALATLPGWGQRHDDSQEPFDVVLMDMQMPVMDGYEATRQLRQHGYTRPILALTAHAMNDDMQKCLDAGCDDYLTKPIVREKFLSTIARYLEDPTTAFSPIAATV